MASLFNHKQGLDINTYENATSINQYSLYIHYYTILVLGGVNYIALAIDPFLGPCYCLSIAYRLPIACLLPALSITDRFGPGPISIVAEYMGTNGNR